MQNALALIEPAVLTPARLLTLDGQRLTLMVAPGQTLAAVLERHIAADLRPHVRAFIHGTEVVDASFTLRAGDSLLLAVVPAGSGAKSILGAVLTLVVAYFAPYWAPELVGALYGVSGATASAALPGLVSAVGVAGTMVAAMAVSALIRPPPINTGGAAGVDMARSYTLSGQSNQAAPYSPCLVVYGRHKVMPLLAANPNVDNLGTVSQFSALYDFGLGNVLVEELKIGDVSIEQFTPQLVLHQDSLCRDLQLNSDRIGYDQYTYQLQQNEPLVLRTKPDTVRANLDIQFPRGLYQVGKDGAVPYTALLYARWRRLGDTDWQGAPIDWYLGAETEYAAPPNEKTLTFDLPGYMPSGPVPYDPTTSPAIMRQAATAWSNATDPGSTYTDAKPNPYLTFYYPNGPIDEGSYFVRYPEILRAGWTRSATNHFESIGSRESRNPGVRVQIMGALNEDYDLYETPQRLHNYDFATFYDPGGAGIDYNVGGWFFINSSSPIPTSAKPSPNAAPWVWHQIAPFEEAIYLARYPDVANWVAQDPGHRSGWQHFTESGALEGRDPYDWFAQVSVRMRSLSTAPLWLRVAYVFPSAGEYELEIRRVDRSSDGSDSSTKDSPYGTVTAQVNEAVVGILRSFQTGAPVQPRLRHTMLEMRVVATDKLSGVVQNLSAIATSILPTTTDGVAFTPKPTRNPAWIALDILTSEKNPRPLSYDQIDWPSWLHFADVCDAPRYWLANGMPFTAPAYTCDTVVSSFTTIKDLVESILAGARASLSLTGAGKWAILVDEEKATPRQLLTPANSWSFSGGRAFTARPHALRVNFVNRDVNYVRDEVIVYADGYSKENAQEFERLDTFGITDYPHAWAYGRYMLAQGLQRSETFSLTLDAENLILQRGDLVLVAHDVPMIGGIPTRVSSVDAAPGANGGQVVHCEIEPAVEVTGYTIRNADGAIRTGAVLFSQVGGLFELDGNAQAEPDDLIVLGPLNRTTAPYLVQSISPASDLTAAVVLVKYVPEVYQADIGELPEWDPTLGTDLVNGTDLAVIDLLATQTLYYVQREPRVDVLLTWRVSGWNLDHYDIAVYSPSGQRRQLASGVTATNYVWTVDALRELDLFGVLLQFEVTPVAGNGSVGLASYVSLSLDLDRSNPAPVSTMGLNIESERIDVFWTQPDEPDIAHYLLRYTPDISPFGDPDWNAAQVLATVAWPTTKTSVGARTGAYGVRVVDTSGNVSPIVWRRTTIAILPRLNVIETVNDLYESPAWAGARSHAVVVGNEVQSEGEFPNIYPDGIYYCEETVDLGDVYEARLASKIAAYAVSEHEYMATWPTLADVAVLASASSSELGEAWAEVRTSDALAVMSDWSTLSAVTVLAAGEESEWSAWRPFMVGDFTAQIFQFRIYLKSYNPGVRVAVTSGLIEVDMSDRVDSYGDVIVPASGLDFVFPVAFRVLEAVAISINGSAAALVARVSGKTAEGFRVTLVDSATQTARAGVIDIQAQGYGRRSAASI